nr:MAG TPA: hypothetical protein [Caudoviricetes sp.]
MTNEELEQKVKRLEEQLTEVRIELLERKASFIPYKPYEVEVPEDVDGYVYINNLGNIYGLNTLTIGECEKIYKRGLAFKTREETERHLKESMLLFKLHKWAKEHNGGWTPDWNDDDETIYEVQFDRFPRYMSESSLVINEIEEVCSFSFLPYFCSYETAREFIKEFEDEIIEVFR